MQILTSSPGCQPQWRAFACLPTCCLLPAARLTAWLPGRRLTYPPTFAESNNHYPLDQATLSWLSWLPNTLPTARVVIASNVVVIVASSWSSFVQVECTLSGFYASARSLKHVCKHVAQCCNGSSKGCNASFQGCNACFHCCNPSNVPQQLECTCAGLPCMCAWLLQRTLETATQRRRKLANTSFDCCAASFNGAATIKVCNTGSMAALRDSKQVSVLVVKLQGCSVVAMQVSMW